MMIMMSGITKVFNKSAKRNFHQRESQLRRGDELPELDKIATIYYDILATQQAKGENKGQLVRDPFLCILYGQRLPRS